jgi:hypothetical protein
MKKAVLALAATLGVFCIQPASFGQGRIDIIQIYENFLASRVAALGCDAVDKATEPKFLSNQYVVTIRATQALKERNGNLSDAELAAKVVAAQNATQAAVKTEIAQNGCSSERIKGLLKLYKLHSEMSLGG